MTTAFGTLRDDDVDAGFWLDQSEVDVQAVGEGDGCAVADGRPTTRSDGCGGHWRDRRGADTDHRVARGVARSALASPARVGPRPDLTGARMIVVGPRRSETS